ncbi:TadE/TadG family type IV pilus assembly protein [Mycoplana rhizolycopersici]|uniref:Pilus assembly protein n=1 Tax=Mycoplana rhizolycopersici TaxID=2746702 RepID=A0ABX2QK50_9HYPH|nr:TadE/TadG family type IV pilus assembly protein [Rhizobium rhizolycopersici]NVP56716.1 pilus assembly protein [Rhizobium rhizolycopersici]
MTKSTRTSSSGRSLKAAFCRLIRARDGAGAVEFAIVMPLLLVGYIGAYEISVAWSFTSKVGRSAATIADVVAQVKEVSPTYLDEMPSIASNLLAPYTANNYTLKITGIQIDDNGNATIAWSRNEAKGVPYVKGTTVQLPSEMTKVESFIVRTELTMPYKVLVAIPGATAETIKSINLHRTSYSRARLGSTITCTTCG